MKTAAIQSAVAAWLAAVLALSATSGAFAQPRMPMEGGVVAQYCVPPPDSFDLHRIYCREGG
jgi:hypothetical protein